jgi:hypothetical protein
MVTVSFLLLLAGYTNEKPLKEHRKKQNAG